MSYKDLNQSIPLQRAIDKAAERARESVKNPDKPSKPIDDHNRRKDKFKWF